MTWLRTWILVTSPYKDIQKAKTVASAKVGV